MLSITVDTLVDEADGSIVDGDISLRDAVAAASWGEIIDFNASLDGGTIRLDPSLGHIAITESLTIDASALPSGLTIDANDPTPGINDGTGIRVFDIGWVVVTLDSLTLTGGDVTGGGGAIRSRAELTVVDSVITGNSASRDGGGVNSHFLTMRDTTVSGNSAGSDGGGVYAWHLTMSSTTISENAAGYRGGGIKTADFMITGSAISRNQSTGDGGGIWVGVGVDRDSEGHAGTGTIIESGITGNSSGMSGGGVYVHGLSDDGLVRIRSSTISGNTANGNGGGLSANGFGGVGSCIAMVRSYHSTIAANVANADSNGSETGGGLFATAGMITTLEHTLLADNDALLSTDGKDVSGAITAKWSLIETVAGATITGANNVLDQDPLLAPLANNGGPTPTHALIEGSPAIDGGNPLAMPGVGGVPEFDQRGTPFGRVEDGDGNGLEVIDIGAFEGSLAIAAIGDARGDGDMNLDSDTDFDDIDDFVLGLTYGGSYEGTYGIPASFHGDTDRDGDIDFDDIDAFMAILTLRWELGGVPAIVKAAAHASSSNTTVPEESHGSEKLSVRYQRPFSSESVATISALGAVAQTRFSTEAGFEDTNTDSSLPALVLSIVPRPAQNERSDLPHTMRWSRPSEVQSSSERAQMAVWSSDRDWLLDIRWGWPE